MREEPAVMENHVLVAYASRYGSTRQVAERFAHVLRDMGGTVDVRDVRDVKDISTYQSVVVGSAIRMDKLLPEAIKFAKRYERELCDRTAAYFVLCVTMKQDTPENRAKARGFLGPLCQIKEPAGVGLFAGKIDYGRLGFFWRMLASQDKSGVMAEGDFRDWERIQAWAREIAPALLR